MHHSLSWNSFELSRFYSANANVGLNVTIRNIKRLLKCTLYYLKCNYHWRWYFFQISPRPSFRQSNTLKSRLASDTFMKIEQSDRVIIRLLIGYIFVLDYNKHFTLFFSIWNIYSLTSNIKTTLEEMLIFRRISEKMSCY